MNGAKKRQNYSLILKADQSISNVTSNQSKDETVKAEPTQTYPS
jgi:hypothetical protein